MSMIPTIPASRSALADLLAEEGIGWHVAHGDVTGAVNTLKKIQALSSEELRAMGLRAQQVVSNRLGRATLTNALCDVFEGRTLSNRTS